MCAAQPLSMRWWCRSCKPDLVSLAVWPGEYAWHGLCNLEAILLVIARTLEDGALSLEIRRQRHDKSPDLSVLSSLWLLKTGAISQGRGRKECMYNRTLGFPGGWEGKKNLPAMQETQVQSLGQKDPQEKRMATHSSISAWRIPWTEDLGQAIHGSQRVVHDQATVNLTFNQNLNKWTNIYIYIYTRTSQPQIEKSKIFY